jgi:hypothetical protein
VRDGRVLRGEVSQNSPGAAQTTLRGRERVAFQVGDLRNAALLDEKQHEGRAFAVRQSIDPCSQLGQKVTGHDGVFQIGCEVFSQILGRFSVQAALSELAADHVEGDGSHPCLELPVIAQLVPIVHHPAENLLDEIVFPPIRTERPSNDPANVRPELLVQPRSARRRIGHGAEPFER